MTTPTTAARGRQAGRGQGRDRFAVVTQDLQASRQCNGAFAFAGVTLREELEPRGARPRPRLTRACVLLVTCSALDVAVVGVGKRERERVKDMEQACLDPQHHTLQRRLFGVCTHRLGSCRHVCTTAMAGRGRVGGRAT